MRTSLFGPSNDILERTRDNEGLGGEVERGHGVGISGTLGLDLGYGKSAYLIGQGTCWKSLLEYCLLACPATVCFFFSLGAGVDSSKPVVIAADRVCLARYRRMLLFSSLFPRLFFPGIARVSPAVS